jgi:16S rRNA (uracil1498-N3)-methyltransferase
LVEQRDRAAIATFFATEPMAAGRITTLSENEAHHARVRRVNVGDRLRLVDGAGMVGYGNVVKLGKAQAMVDIDLLDHVEPLPVMHLIVPIADKDRMLLVAEKATELGAFSWRPVMWRRSRNVSPRGEGAAFQARVRARMVGALTQSGGAWLPVLYPDATPDRALAACPAGTRWLLDAQGEPAGSLPISAPMTIAVGPEGGLDPAERADFLANGFTPVRLAPFTLRFETAAIVGLGLVRAALTSASEKVRV